MWGVIRRIPLLRLLAPSLKGDVAPTRVDHRAERQDVALVLVHGFSGNTRATWAGFVELLLGESTINTWDLYGVGYSSSLRVDVPNVWSADPDIEILARGLRTTLSLPPFDRYRCIAIAAHSMGGLVVQRAILDDRELANRLSHLFLFGTPSDGLMKARAFARLKRQVRDMVAASPFIRSLRADWAQRFGAGTPFTFRSVAGDRDEFVPASSSLSPFADAVRAVVPGNHLEIVKPTGLDHQSFVLVIDALKGGAKVRPVVDGARLAVELGDFHAAVETLLPRAENLDDAALASLALALEGIGRGDQALAVLERHYGGGAMTSTEALGVLAGRLKRRWLVERAAGDWSRARDLYRLGLDRAEAECDHDQAFYHAINVGFLELIASPPASAVPASARSMAERAQSHCAQAGETHWRLATEGEAHLMVGDLDQAEMLYSRAIALTGSPREIDSMYSQAIRVATRVFGSNGADRIERLFGLEAVSQ